MNAVKRIILILLLLLLLGGTFLSDPLVRFTLDLDTQHFQDAEAVYLSRLSAYAPAEQEAQSQLQRYAERQLQRFYAQQLSLEEVMDRLTSLSQTSLPQEDVAPCLQKVSDLSNAQEALAQADALFAEGAYAEAIPLYRQADPAGDAAAFGLEQAQMGYRNQLLTQAEAAMDAGELEAAENILLEGSKLWEADGDIARALEDVRRLQAEEANEARTEEAQRLLKEEGPEAAFRYVAELREQAPEEYGLEYLEQVIFHEYEEDVCAQARALRESGDPAAACDLLEEGLKLLDSGAMRTLRAEIMASIPFLLGDMPILRDETASPRTSATSTIVRDAALTDAFDTTYEHSLSADAGAVTFALDGSFALFSGTVACPAGEAADIYRTSATLRILADGKLLSEFKDMDSASPPLPFSLPVDGVRELTLLWTSEGANGWKDWGRFATVFDGKLFTAAPAQ